MSSKGAIKNRCSVCGRAHILQASKSTFGRWYGTCPACGAEYLGQGRHQEKPADIKITLVNQGARTAEKRGEMLSECCDARPIPETDLCSKCNEHAVFYDEYIPVDRLAESLCTGYDFRDEHGHPLCNCMEFIVMVKQLREFEEDI